ncbi:MAG TPA: hypothetical protein VFD48_07835 [Pyrinomonadaceae bacterium]|nr:hypothetical protein [Pyrinomonadaceae bacterium]
MGKWAEVQCVCPNRVPLPGSDFYFDEPHRKKRRLTKKEKAEVDEWERTTKNRFECGHRSGLIIELCPGDIIHLGNLLGSILRDDGNRFEVFVKVGDWRCYEDELLLIQPDEAGLWLIEIEEVQRAFQGFGNLPQEKIERLALGFYRDDLGSRLDLERRLDDVAEMTHSGPVNQMRSNVQQMKRPDIDSTVDTIIEALTDSAKLCRASIEIGSPIRLLW